MYGNISTIMNDDDLKKMGLFKLYNDTEDIPLKQDPFAKVDIKYRDATPEPERKLPLSFYDILIPDYPKGSNSWVVSGKLTASGKPILVNDPHLDNNMPAYWYQT
jgi:acyl-homoserine lactone acylase PvdQ